MKNFLPKKKFSWSKKLKKKIFFFKSENPKDFRVLNCSLGPSGSSNPIKSGENEWEQCFLYLKSKKPIKVTKSYWEQLFQQGNAEFIAKKKFSWSKKI